MVQLYIHRYFDSLIPMNELMDTDEQIQDTGQRIQGYRQYIHKYMYIYIYIIAGKSCILATGCRC